MSVLASVFSNGKSGMVFFIKNGKGKIKWGITKNNMQNLVGCVMN